MQSQPECIEQLLNVGWTRAQVGGALQAHGHLCHSDGCAFPGSTRDLSRPTRVAQRTVNQRYSLWCQDRTLHFFLKTWQSAANDESASVTMNIPPRHKLFKKQGGLRSWPVNTSHSSILCLQRKTASH